MAPRERKAMRWAARNIEPPKEVYSFQFTVYNFGEEKRKAYTEFTEDAEVTEKKMTEGVES